MKQLIETDNLWSSELVPHEGKTGGDWIAIVIDHYERLKNQIAWDGMVIIRLIKYVYKGEKAENNSQLKEHTETLDLVSILWK